MDTERIEKAAALFAAGFNCAQAVLAPFAAELDEEVALRLATGFGGGFARHGEVCGAVCGAVLAIGLKHGRGTLADMEARERAYQMAGAFMEAFRKKHGGVRCRDLIGYDLSNPEEYEAARKEDVFRRICPEFVRSAAGILQDLLLARCS